MSVGLELEYWVIDEAGELVSAADLLDIHNALVPEFVEPMLEIQVPPADGIAELRQNVTTILETVLARAADLDKHLVPLGTPLTEHRFPITTDRGKLLQKYTATRFGTRRIVPEPTFTSTRETLVVNLTF
jgi:glutamate---cysteine ligase / carboxylate-amine ligase